MRSLFEALQIALQLRERQLRQEHFREEGFDIGALPIGKLKASKIIRLAPLSLAIYHVTDVTGGFGVSKRRLKYWRDALVNHPERIPDAIREQLPDVDIEKNAHRLTLWERYRNTPYHTIGATNGDALRNRRLKQRSYHAGLGNDGAGWALDVGHKEELDDWLIETGRASFRIHLMRIRDGDDPEVTLPDRRIMVAPHRTVSSQRFADTSRNVHLNVIKPVVQQLDFATLDYDFSRGHGRPIPDTWDPDAHYNRKGQRL